MSNRVIKHSARYRGPAGDSRPAGEIFAGIEARAIQAKPFADRLTAAMDNIWEHMTLTSPEGRIETVRELAVTWLLEHDLDFRERYEEDTDG